MAKFVKILLFLLLTFALYGIASNVSAEQVEEHKSVVAFSGIGQDELGLPELPLHPVADLNSNLHTNHLSMTRVQRAQANEYISSLKNVLLSCASRESSLSQHRKRLFTTTTSYFCHPVSEYYVFALRRIII